MNINDNNFIHIFKCGTTILTRKGLESFPCPFCTKNVTDDVMRKIVKEINRELKKYSYDRTLDEEKLKLQREDNLYYEMDIVAVKYGVPYYENFD